MNSKDRDNLLKALGEAAEEFFSEEVKDLNAERDALKSMIDGLKDNLTLLHGLVVPQPEVEKVEVLEVDTPQPTETEEEVVAEEVVAEEVVVEEVIPEETPESLGLSTKDEPVETPEETPESLGLIEKEATEEAISEEAISEEAISEEAKEDNQEGEDV